MSSHREAPESSKDPVADNTDVYAFRSHDEPDKVTIIANFIPFQKPDGGPNFYEFGEDVQYDINISNGNKAEADIIYRFRFRTEVRSPKTFLYNTGPIKHITDKTWNRPTYFSVTKVTSAGSTVLARGLPMPPVNVGPRSTPDYADLAAEGVHTYNERRKVFAGQRADGFFVDLGSIFDLGALRPFQALHAYPPKVNQDGVNSLKTLNVHTIALQVPISDLTYGKRRPTNVLDPHATIGVWATAARQTSTMIDKATGRRSSSGPWQQVSRLGNPLFNEVLTPMAEKDEWNHHSPKYDGAYAKYVDHPELAKLLPVLYPGNTFKNLSKYSKSRADLDAILLTGIPKGVIDGFQNYTGPRKADMLRLNVAVPPSDNPRPLGLVDPDNPDPAGYPNGRRPIDDVTTIELRAIAGLTIPLVDKDYTVDAAAQGIKDGSGDGSDNSNGPFLSTFPYLGTPNGGYETMPGTSSPDNGS